MVFSDAAHRSLASETRGPSRCGSPRDGVSGPTGTSWFPGTRMPRGLKRWVLIQRPRELA